MLFVLVYLSVNSQRFSSRRGEFSTLYVSTQPFNAIHKQMTTLHKEPRVRLHCHLECKSTDSDRDQLSYIIQGVSSDGHNFASGFKGTKMVYVNHNSNRLVVIYNFLIGFYLTCYVIQIELINLPANTQNSQKKR